MTKGELAQRILKILGVNTRTSEASPEEVQDILEIAEDWLLSNNAIGRRLGYVQSGDVPDPEDESGLPSWSILGVSNSVAMAAASYFGKSINPSIQMNAASGMQTIMSKTVEVQEVQYPARMPRGHTYSPWGPKYYDPTDRIITSNDYLSDEGDDPITSP